MKPCYRKNKICLRTYVTESTAEDLQKSLAEVDERCISEILRTLVEKHVDTYRNGSLKKAKQYELF